MSDVDDHPNRIKDIRVYRNSFLGMGVLICTTFLIFGTWSLYGAAGAFPQFALWLVLFGLACRWFMARPGRVLGLGAVSVLVWVGVVLLNR